jgi:hypothetical protein
MKKITLLALLSPSLLADTMPAPSTTITPGTGIIVNCDGCDEPPIPKDPEPAVKLVTECPKPQTIVKWKTKEVVKWKTKEVIKEIAPVTNNNYYSTGGTNQVHLNKPHRLTVLVGAPYKAVTEYEMKDEDFAHTYPLAGVEYSQLLTQSINFSVGVWSDRFLFTGLGYNY